MLVSTRFQVLFHSPLGVLFTFPSRYCFSIGHQVVFRLGWWSTHLPTGFHVSGGTLDPARSSSLSHTGLSPSMVGLPQTILLDTSIRYAVRTPKIRRPSVWPFPRSLATTSGISVDVFSSPYLDVSVQVVPHVHLCVQCTLHRVCLCGFPHSDICGSMDMCSSPQLFAACHVLLRLPMPRHSPCALFA